MALNLTICAVGLLALYYGAYQLNLTPITRRANPIITRHVTYSPSDIHS